MNANAQARRFDGYLQNLLCRVSAYDFTDKPSCIKSHISYMLNRTQMIFQWSGLPNTIPARMLELYLQTNGNVCFYKHNGDLYVFTGGMGGEPDVYHMPTIYTIADPALNLSKSLRIGLDCIVMPNDSLYEGLLPLYYRYATSLTETELSLNIALINSRIIDLISAPDDRTRVSAEKYLSDISAGKLGVIAENAFLDGIRVQPYATQGNRTLTDLIETEQYFKASWYNDIGLNANFNMKRESLNATEAQMNNDALLPLVDDMLRNRRTAIAQVNDMFGTDIRVTLASSWLDNAQEIELAHKEFSGRPENKEGGNDTV